MHSILLGYGKSLELNRICVEEPNLFERIHVMYLIWFKTIHWTSLAIQTLLITAKLCPKNVSIDDGAKLLVHNVAFILALSNTWCFACYFHFLRQFSMTLHNEKYSYANFHQICFSLTGDRVCRSSSWNLNKERKLGGCQNLQGAVNFTPQFFEFIIGHNNSVSSWNIILV